MNLLEGFGIMKEGGSAPDWARQRRATLSHSADSTNIPRNPHRQGISEWRIQTECRRNVPRLRISGASKPLRRFANGAYFLSVFEVLEIFRALTAFVGISFCIAALCWGERVHHA